MTLFQSLAGASFNNRHKEGRYTLLAIIHCNNTLTVNFPQPIDFDWTSFSENLLDSITPHQKIFHLIPIMTILDNFENWPFSGQWPLTPATENPKLPVESVLIDRFQKTKKFYTRPNQKNQTRWKKKCFCLMATKMKMF